MPHKLIKNIFILAGIINIFGILMFSKFLTNDAMMTAQPAVLGAFGLVSIMLWGLAYIAVNENYAQVRWLVAVFAIEKLIYALMWLSFIRTQSLAAVYESDMLAGLFYTIYGPNDFIFMLFFAYVFFTSKKSAA